MRKECDIVLSKGRKTDESPATSLEAKVEGGVVWKIENIIGEKSSTEAW